MDTNAPRSELSSARATIQLKNVKLSTTPRMTESDSSIVTQSDRVRV